MVNRLEFLGHSSAQTGGSADLSPLTTANPLGGFLSGSRSELSTSLQPENTVRASAALAQPDPGNTLSNAFKIGTLDTTPRTFSDAVGSLDRNDYYQFSVNDRTNLNLSLQGLSTNANLQLLSGNGTILNRSTRTGTANEAISQALEPGTHYVRVYTASGNTNYTLGLSSSPIVPPAPTPTPTPTPTDFVQQVLALTNQFRSQNGVAPLTLNIELNATALGHSQDMALQDYFSHTGKDGSAPWDRAKEVGYETRTMGENIAAGYSTPEAVVEGWKNSSGHRANLLNPNFTELGVGYYYLANDTGSVNYNRYWTQVFGSGDLNPATNLPVT